MSGEVIVTNFLENNLKIFINAFRKAQTTFFHPITQLIKFHPKEITSHEVRDLYTKIYIKKLYKKIDESVLKNRGFPIIIM